MPTVGPLRSTGVTPLPRYYGPLRLPTQPQVGYVFPTHVAHNSSTTSGLPGSSADLCVRAVPNHPGRSDGCSRSFLPHRRRASPHPEDWPLSIGVTRPTRVRLRYGSHARSTGLRILDHSSNRLLLYLVNEQLPGIPPLRYPDQLDLSWRSGKRAAGFRTQNRAEATTAAVWGYYGGGVYRSPLAGPLPRP